MKNILFKKFVENTYKFYF